MATIEPPSKRQKLAETYTYTEIGNLKEGDTRACFYGILKCFFEPKRSRGTDWSCHFLLIDPSCGDNPMAGLKVMWFRSEVSELPPFQNIGDVVRCHRVGIQSFNSELQACGRKRQSSMALFSGQANDSCDPVWSSSPNPTVTDSDRAKVAELRRWAATSTVLEQERLGANGQLLSALPAEDATFCLMCQVIQVHKSVGLSSPRAAIRVWDGSCPSRPVANAFEPNHYDENAVAKLVPRGWAVDVTVYDQNATYAVLLKPGDLIKIPKVEMKAAPGGVGLNPDNKPVELVLHTSYSPNEDANFTVLKTAACPDLMERLRTAPAPRPCEPVRSMMSSCTVAGNPWLKFSTVDEIKKSMVPNKFRLRCAVTDFLPRRVPEMAVLCCSQCSCMFSMPEDEQHGTCTRSGHGQPVAVDSSASFTCRQRSSGTRSASADKPVSSGGSTERDMPAEFCDRRGLWYHKKKRLYCCPHCSPKQDHAVQLQVTYRFCLLLEDQTGQLTVRCIGDDAEEFLQIQACDLTCNNASREGIETCLRTLVGDGGPGNRHDSEEDRLLVECCVMSYHKLLGPVNPSTKSGSLTKNIAYRLFDTSYEVA